MCNKNWKYIINLWLNFLIDYTEEKLREYTVHLYRVLDTIQLLILNQIVKVY